MSDRPVVLLSSTLLDLPNHRPVAREVCAAQGFAVRLADPPDPGDRGRRRPAVLGLSKTAASNRYVRALVRLKAVLAALPGGPGA